MQPLKLGLDPDPINGSDYWILKLGLLEITTKPSNNGPFMTESVL